LLTHRQTDKNRQKHYLLGVGNKWSKKFLTFTILLRVILKLSRCSFVPPLAQNSGNAIGGHVSFSSSRRRPESLACCGHSIYEQSFKQSLLYFSNGETNMTQILNFVALCYIFCRYN